MTFRNRQCVFSIPAPFEPIPYHPEWKAQFNRPKGHGLSLRIKRKQMISSAIIALLGVCRPSAVAGLVIAIIVSSIQCHVFRPFSHILSKSFEAVPPTLANRYPSAAVVLPHFVIRIAASVNHPSPRIVRCSPASSVDSFGFCRPLALITSARLSMAAPHSACLDYGAISTVTTARPKYACPILSVFYPVERFDKKTIEFFPGKILASELKSIDNLNSHDRSNVSVKVSASNLLIADSRRDSFSSNLPIVK